MNAIGILIILGVLFVVAAFSLFYYVFSLVLLDAKSRGIKNPKFWSLVAAGGQHGEGLLLYLFNRRKTVSNMTDTESARFLQLKKKIYYLMAVDLFLFLAAVIALMRFT